MSIHIMIDCTTMHEREQICKGLQASLHDPCTSGCCMGPTPCSACACMIVTILVLRSCTEQCHVTPRMHGTMGGLTMRLGGSAPLGIQGVGAALHK